MPKKSFLYTVKSSLKANPVFTIAAKDFAQAARRAEKILSELDLQAEILEIKREQIVMIEDLTP